MKKTLLIPLLFVILMTSCSKKETQLQPVSQPLNPVTTTSPIPPATGIQGTVTPALSITSASVTRIGDDGRVNSYSVKPDNNGRFEIASIPAGTYTLIFTAAGGYNAPESQTVSVTSAQVLDAGKFDVEKQISGNIDGTVAPAGTVSQVAVTNTATPNVVTTTVTPDAAGNFVIPTLSPGLYTLKVTPVSGSGLNAPISRQVMVPNGKTVHLSPLQLTAVQPVAPISAVVNGTPATIAGPLQATYAASTFKFSVTLNNAIFNISIDRLTGPGDYICNQASTSTVTLQRKTLATILQGDWTEVMKMQSWSSAIANAGVTITITAIDPVNQIISGTFSGTLGPTNSYTQGVTTITDGSFNVPYSSY